MRREVTETVEVKDSSLGCYGRVGSWGEAGKTSRKGAERPCLPQYLSALLVLLKLSGFFLTYLNRRI